MTIRRKLKKALQGDFTQSKARHGLTPGAMLKTLRQKNELSQSELALATGMTQATVSSLETSRIQLGAERARVLARALHVHPAVLLFPDWDEDDLAA